ncbi:MAG TPA: RND transporter [Gammaproteobacteria bacterium]|nr:RND transporter [Gammaproteobacteria bacterium]
MFKYIDRIPVFPLAVVAIFMLLAPFKPEPHLLEKSRMLLSGELSRPIDIFDLFWHGFWMVLLVLRLARLKKSADKK